MPILLGVLEEDATQDVETAKAVVETLSLLCEVEELDGRVSHAIPASCSPAVAGHPTSTSRSVPPDS